MALEDDAQSCYYDAQSIASERSDSDSSEELNVVGGWRSHWSPVGGNLARQYQYRDSPTIPANIPLQSSDEVDSEKEQQRGEEEASESSATTSSNSSTSVESGKSHDSSKQRRHTSSGTTRSGPLQNANSQRPSTSGAEYSSARENGAIMSQSPIYTRQARSKTASSYRGTADGEAFAKLPAIPNNADMNRVAKASSEDLFLELANDQTVTEERTRPTSRGEQLSSRFGFSNKRRSLPVENGLLSPTERRPKSSGHVLGSKASPRTNRSVDLQRHIDLHRGILNQPDDVASISSRSQSGAPRRYGVVPDRTSSLAEQLRSPELPQYGRRRPSFGTSPRQMPPRTRSSLLASQAQDSHSESPAEGSEPKQSLPDSASVDSETADTVWDELDDLKSRIKKLELTGKLPQTSGAAISTEPSERPRTATTAPTTIDSSPKHDKAEKEEKQSEPQADVISPDPQAEYIVGGPDAANIHPNLHGALAKAKGLINPSLYRSLEATAADALQLAAMTGSAGPQGTALTAAAIINGVTVSDRHVRRKADTMCRNLTDLVLALCEGKSEAASLVSSPVAINTPAKISPTFRYTRNSLSPNGGLSRTTSRPMSRLEARRTSILGSQAGSTLGTSPVESGEDFSASEHESTRSYPRIREPRNFARAPSRLQAARQRRYEATQEDEDPTIRPPSRAMTDIGRVKPSSSNQFSTPQRSPSLRESLAARRVNEANYSGNRDLSRVASLSDSGRRRFLDPNTPPVVEEDVNDEEYQSASQKNRRITSYGGYAARRSLGNVPNRSTSLHQSRQVMVE